MADSRELAEQREETRLIIKELLEDGSDPDAEYIIEHHISCENFETLEKAAVEVFKLGYEVTDAEEIETESGEILFCFDAVSEMSLKAEYIDAQVEQLLDITEKMKVNYDGWGTYFEDPDAEFDEEYDEEEAEDEEDKDASSRLH